MSPHLIIHSLLLVILTLITWFSLCLLGFSSVNVTFLPLHTLFFEASQYVQPTLERRKIKPHVLQQGIPKNLQIFCFFFVFLFSSSICSFSPLVEYSFCLGSSLQFLIFFLGDFQLFFFFLLCDLRWFLHLVFYSPIEAVTISL